PVQTRRRVRATPVHRSAKSAPRLAARKEALPKQKQPEAKAPVVAKEPALELEQIPLAVIDALPTPEEPAPRSRERGAYDSDTAIKLYLREIGLVKLLTPQEEIELAARIKKGDKKAREQMIKANLRLVVKIARDYEGIGLPLLDLISEGNIGLMKAVERFDPAKGGKLST